MWQGAGARGLGSKSPGLEVLGALTSIPGIGKSGVLSPQGCQSRVKEPHSLMLSRFQKDAERRGRERFGTHPQSSGVSLTTTMNWGSLGLQPTTLCPSNPTPGQSDPPNLHDCSSGPTKTLCQGGRDWVVGAGQGQGGGSLAFHCLPFPALESAPMDYPWLLFVLGF